MRESSLFRKKSTRGKVYLDRIPMHHDPSEPAVIKSLKEPLRYPSPNNFSIQKGLRSISVLSKHELKKLARRGGNMMVNGFKRNLDEWPYHALPCPLFKTCWQFRHDECSNIGRCSLAASNTLDVLALERYDQKTIDK